MFLNRRAAGSCGAEATLGRFRKDEYVGGIDVDDGRDEDEKGVGVVGRDLLASSVIRLALNICSNCLVRATGS